METTDTFKKILNCILYPKTTVIVLFTPLSVLLLLYSFLVTKTDLFMSVTACLLSAYTLAVILLKIPSMIDYAKRVKEENKYINRYTTDAKLRVKISLYISVFLNSIYSVFQLVLGIEHNSLWFYSLSAYYFLLVLMRFFLLRDMRGLRPGADVESEFHRYRFCGVVLLVMHEVLVLIVFFMTYFGKTFEHRPITTVAMAIYTFIALTVSTINIIRYRKYKSPILSACKAVSLAATAVSVLTLMSAMLNSFGSSVERNMREHMIFVTGAAVCILIMSLAISMIIHSTRELKNLK